MTTQSTTRVSAASTPASASLVRSSQRAHELVPVGGERQGGAPTDRVPVDEALALQRRDGVGDGGIEHDRRVRVPNSRFVRTVVVVRELDHPD